MKEILCTRGLAIYVDDEDYDRLSKHEWTTRICGHTYYAKNNYLGAIHRIIMKTPTGLVVHHKDGDGLNNQKDNLLNCTNQENSWYKKGKPDNWCRKVKREDRITNTDKKDVEYYTLRNVLKDALCDKQVMPILRID